MNIYIILFLVFFVIVAIEASHTVHKIQQLVAARRTTNGGMNTQTDCEVLVMGSRLYHLGMESYKSYISKKHHSDNQFKHGRK